MTAKKRLRSGYTTGACAAAAAKAASVHLLGGTPVARVSIPFPDGQHRIFSVQSSTLTPDPDGAFARASVIKDAGDDPDVTNGAEIMATVQLCRKPARKKSGETQENNDILFLAGEGVGTVTKPGLAVPVGEPAINPVPRRMIKEAIFEAVGATSLLDENSLSVTISVANGKQLADKTLNHRLGIIGGISILGTTGIVTPVSAEAWTATIQASMDVAISTGAKEIVLSTGRTSEKGVQKVLQLPIEAYAMMGDYLKFSLEAAKIAGFRRIHLAAMWAKIVKAAMQIPQTHVRHGALEAQEAAVFISKLSGSATLLAQLDGVNTAREIYGRLMDHEQHQVVRQVCLAAKAFAEKTAMLPVDVYLVNSALKVVEHV